MSTHIDRTAPGAGDESAPPPDELLAMAFADGELTPEERLAFEQRMVHEEGLARLVSEHMALDVLARRVAPKEPQDHEWERLRLNPLFIGSRSTGWVLLVLGSVATLALTVFGVATNESLVGPDPRRDPRRPPGLPASLPDRGRAPTADPAPGPLPPRGALR